MVRQTGKAAGKSVGFYCTEYGNPYSIGNDILLLGENTHNPSVVRGFCPKKAFSNKYGVRGLRTE